MTVVKGGWGQHTWGALEGTLRPPQTCTHGNPPLRHLLQLCGSGKWDLGGLAWLFGA